jgi:hypothetical protein
MSGCHCTLAFRIGDLHQGTLRLMENELDLLLSSGTTTTLTACLLVDFLDSRGLAGLFVLLSNMPFYCA